MRRGLALEASAGPSAYPHPVPLIWFQCTDDVEATRERHAREADWARDHSDETPAAERLSIWRWSSFTLVAATSASV